MTNYTIERNEYRTQRYSRKARGHTESVRVVWSVRRNGEATSFGHYATRKAAERVIGILKQRDAGRSA